MDVKSPTQAVVARLIPPLTMWAIGKILESPGVQDGVAVLDSRVSRRGREMKRSLRRGVRNAKANIPLLAAGAAAIVVGIVLVSKAARGR